MRRKRRKWGNDDELNNFEYVGCDENGKRVGRWEKAEEKVDWKIGSKFELKSGKSR